MFKKDRSHLVVILACLTLGLTGCDAKAPVLSVRNLVEARFGTPPLVIETLTVRAMVSATSIEGLYVRDIGCLDFCENVLSLKFSGDDDHGRASTSSTQERVLDQALKRARADKRDFACMVLKVKPRTYRSPSPNLLGARYRIGALEFVEVVDTNACPRSPEDHPLRLDQQPRFTFNRP